MDDDAPPSYEDAMADEVGPVDGPRRNFDTTSAPAFEDIGPVDGGRPNYNPPLPQRTPTLTLGSASTGDSNTFGLPRRQSERLFPDSTGFSAQSRDSSFDRGVSDDAVSGTGIEDGGRVMSTAIQGEKQGPP